MRGALLVAGTTSDAGKSVITAGICRWLSRQGVRVAPFKAQNMSNNSVVTSDGGEIGRAQALQAAACGLAPDVRFNPVLLKPGSDRTSQLVVLGQPAGDLDARDYLRPRPRLAELVQDTLADLRSAYDVVICEGAGSPTEINLRATDIVNMGLARAANLPTIVVADIDRGGMFAACYGTVALLDKEDQALIAGFVVNKFRGDPRLLDPGLETLRRVTGRPTYGVVPFSLDLWLDSEDSLPGPGVVLGRRQPPVGEDWLRVAVVRLPRISNPTDVDALATEPGVMVRLAASPVELADADLVVLPGTKATVDDLDWLRRTGLAEAVANHAAQGKPVLGICGGYQMLGERIHDDVESRRGVVDGLGLLPVRVSFGAAKTLSRPIGTAFGDIPVGGYEIHHGQAAVTEGTEPLFRLPGGGGEGARVNAVFGTHWHGAFEHDSFRRAFLSEAARLAGRTGFTVAPGTDFAALREGMLDLLGDLVAEHLDTKALSRLIEGGSPPDLPFLPPGAGTEEPWSLT
ncbi:MAG TPA: cobyric acid synthase [Micromonosporaceae bacterium]